MTKPAGSAGRAGPCYCPDLPSVLVRLCDSFAATKSYGETANAVVSPLTLPAAGSCEVRRELRLVVPIKVPLLVGPGSQVLFTDRQFYCMLRGLARVPVAVVARSSASAHGKVSDSELRFFRGPGFRTVY